MENLPKEAWGAIASILAAFIAVVSAIYNYIFAEPYWRAFFNKALNKWFI